LRLCSADFALTGVDAVVTVFVRDTEATGFPASLAGGADAVFLDLPGPHRVAPSAVASLRPDGMLCSFSPCIEQVQRMCLALAEEGMTEIRTVEVLNREYEFQRRQLLLPPPEKAEQAEAAGDEEGAARKRARTDGEVPEPPAAQSAAVDAAAATPAEAQAADAVPPAAKQGRRDAAPTLPLPRAEPRLLVWPCAEARGHTGYLTFARKPTEERDGEAAAADDSDAE
jgi:tRNA (adenine57-N1/adenine58-N1)-methyltransferase